MENSQESGITLAPVPPEMRPQLEGKIAENGAAFNLCNHACRLQNRTRAFLRFLSGMSSFSFYFHADDRAAASFRSHFTVDIARFQIKRRLTAAGILFDKLSGLAVGKRVGNFLVTSENQLDLAVFISDSIQRAERKQRNDIAAFIS